MSAMDRAVAAWETLKSVYDVKPSRLRMRALLIMLDTNDYEFLDCLMIQVEPQEIPEIITPLLRSLFKDRKHLIAWDQLRDKTWNMDSSKEWRHLMRGLDPRNCERYDKFIAAGGYAGVLNKLGVEG